MIVNESKSEALEDHNRTAKEFVTISNRLKKLLDLQLDNLIDEETFQNEHDRLIMTKNALKSRIREAESGCSDPWIEPIGDAVKTLQRATDLSFSTKDSEMSEIVRKVGTNHTFSNGLVHLKLAPPFDSVAQILAQAGKSVERKKRVASSENRERKLVCGAWTRIEPN